MHAGKRVVVRGVGGAEDGGGGRSHLIKFLELIDTQHAHTHAQGHTGVGRGRVGGATSEQVLMGNL